jgi:hypothetical protein
VDCRLVSCADSSPGLIEENYEFLFSHVSLASLSGERVRACGGL